MSRLKVYDLATGTWGYAGGVNPIALAADSAFTSKFLSITNEIGHNLLDNGEFLINQRYAIGGSFISMNNPTSDVYFSDRWMMVNTVTNMAVYPAVPPPRWEDFVVMLIVESQAALTPTGTNSASVKQYIEGRKLQHLEWGTARAKSVTLNFVGYFTSTSSGVPGGTIIVELQAGTRCISQAVLLTATMARYSVTFPGDTVGAIANDNLTGLKLRFWFSAGDGYTAGSVLNTTWSVPTTNTRAKGVSNLFWASGNQFGLTGVQLKVGSVTTPFEHISYGPSLQECQRYFQRLPYFKMNGVTLVAANSGVARMGASLPVVMRAVPTIAIINGPINVYDGASIGTIASITTSYSQPNLIEFDTSMTITAAGSGSVRAVTTYMSGSWAIDAIADLV